MLKASEALAHAMDSIAYGREKFACLAIDATYNFGRGPARHATMVRAHEFFVKCKPPEADIDRTWWKYGVKAPRLAALRKAKHDAIAEGD